MNKTQTYRQMTGLRQSQFFTNNNKQYSERKTTTYTFKEKFKWSSLVADPSLPPVARGQRHGPREGGCVSGGWYGFRCLLLCWGGVWKI